MKNVVCFKHRAYDGSSTPDLSCKTCCTKYISHIKTNVAKKNAEQRSKVGFDAYNWLDKKAAVQEAQSHKLAINPGFI